MKYSKCGAILNRLFLTCRCILALFAMLCPCFTFLSCTYLFATTKIQNLEHVGTDDERGGNKCGALTSSSAAVWGEGSWLFGVMEDANVTSKAVSEVVEVAVAAVAVRVEA